MTGDSLISWLGQTRGITAFRVRRKVWRCKGFSFRKLVEIEARAKRSRIWAAVEEEAAKGRTLDFGDPLDALKYLHTDYWLRENVIRAAGLELHRQRPLTILDLGTGSAMFPYVCSLLGHHVAGLDQPFESCRLDELRVYSVIPTLLGVPVQRDAIKRFEPLSLAGTYDLITAFMICFNEHRRPHEWQRAEWEFFLSDLCQYVSPGGRICLAFNPHAEKYGELKFYDAPIISLFGQWGRIDRPGQVTILRDRVVDAAPRASFESRFATVRS